METGPEPRDPGTTTQRTVALSGGIGYGWGHTLAVMDAKLEAEVLARFITPTKQERCLGFAADPRRRSKLLQELRQPSVFDERYVIEISAGQRTPETLIQQFRELGMAGRVYVISSNSEWDCCKFQMSWFVAEFHATGFDTLAFCWKSKTAFYEQHHSGFTYFLRRP